MKKISTSTMKPALAALAFALALGASARAQDSKAVETVVRERRATTSADAPKTAAEPKAAQADNRAGASPSSPTPTTSASTSTSPASASPASPTRPASASGDELEELKSQIASASNPASASRAASVCLSRPRSEGFDAEAICDFNSSSSSPEADAGRVGDAGEADAGDVEVEAEVVGVGEEGEAPARLSA